MTDVCERCEQRAAKVTVPGLDLRLCVPCEYARIRRLPANSLWSPVRGLDVAELFYSLHGKPA